MAKSVNGQGSILASRPNAPGIQRACSEAVGKSALLAQGVEVGERKPRGCDLSPQVDQE
ncbi:MAG: hypothetical protein ABJG41_02840 [Cyclobacteriaceae bacterium]